MIDATENKIYLNLEPAGLAAFFPLLQQGVRVEIEVGTSLNDMLCSQFQLSPAYIENRLQTIFFNGHPVDDLEKAVVIDGTALAFSAAMPGLVGATLRRGGELACFRHQISHRGDEAPGQSGRGMVSVRLFNLLLKELGPVILARGVYMTSGELTELLETLIPDNQSGILSARVNGHEVGREELMNLRQEDQGDRTCLQVEFTV